MEITRSTEPVVVRVSGKVGFSATDEFAAAIAGAAVVDLTEVTWLGAAACAELVWAHQASGPLRVLLPPRAVIESPEVLARLTSVQWVAPRLPRQPRLRRHAATSTTRDHPVGVG